MPGLSSPGLLLLLLAASLLVATAAVSESPPPDDGAIMDVAGSLPQRLGEWQRGASAALYDRESIFKYMNGAGEVYLSFAFKELFVAHYSRRGEDEITVELYDMGNPADAFGIFSRNRQGEDAGIGQGSEYRSGYLVFWRGRYFATIFAGKESEGSRRFAFELARRIVAAIGEDGGLPQVVSLLPREDLLEPSIRYFHQHTDLNQHYFISDDNLLALGPETEAIIANYERGDEFIYLLIVHYADAGSAEAAFSDFINSYMPEGGDTGVAEIEDGFWAAAARTGEHLLAAFDARTAERGRALLVTARARIEEGVR
jgi:hypothetical protein